MKWVRYLLFPFAILYGLITGLRNYFFKIGWLSSKKYELPVICVGNLSVGGTGKSPMIEYLLSFLEDAYHIAVLSRGYGRKTVGFLEVNTNHNAQEVGDEPLQIKKKFPSVTVAVCADRQTGIEQLKTDSDVILLDDAFQHRKVTPSFSILLTPFNDLYSNDFMLPTGNLREPRVGASRADIIVVTKCPDKVAYAKLQEIQFKLNLQEHQKVYFSRIAYATKLNGFTESLPLSYLEDKRFTLVTGIANPRPLVAFLKEQNFDFEHQAFADHHDFSASEIEKLQTVELIITTEKDYMRLQPKLNKFALYYLPITTTFLNEQGAFFEERIIDAIEGSLR